MSQLIFWSVPFWPLQPVECFSFGLVSCSSLSVTLTRDWESHRRAAGSPQTHTKLPLSVLRRANLSLIQWDGCVCLLLGFPVLASVAGASWQGQCWCHVNFRSGNTHYSRVKLWRVLQLCLKILTWTLRFYISLLKTEFAIACIFPRHQSLY